jgi:hypothetical protein
MALHDRRNLMSMDDVIKYEKHLNVLVISDDRKLF